MQILFDQGTPVPLKQFLDQHSVSTAHEQGWSELGNGELLQQAEQAGFELLITTDQNLQYQQNLSERVIAVLVLESTSWPRIQSVVPVIQAAVQASGPNSYQQIPIPFQ